VSFRNTEIDLASLSTYNIRLLPEEVGYVRDYIELPKFQAWLYKQRKNGRMTAQLLSECQQLQTEDIFDYLHWPRDILALRLPLYKDGTTLQDIIYPQLLVKVARVINKTREEATGDAIAKHGASTSGRKRRAWMLLLVTSALVVLIAWLCISSSWNVQGVADAAFQGLARVQVAGDRLLSNIYAHLA
jgi:hypothetical protein